MPLFSVWHESEALGCEVDWGSPGRMPDSRGAIQGIDEDVRIPGDLLALRPEGFLWLGLLATLSTPLLRVGASVVGFLGAGERRMAGLGTTVLIIIALAVVVAQLTAA